MNYNIIEFISEGYIILVPVLYIIGEFVKNSREINDRYIPLILMSIGIIFGVGFSFVHGESLLEAIVNGTVQGILTAGAAVLSDQILKQMVEKKNDDD